jgi:16S rRNA (guanine527-N7)-methyltransferase
LAKPRSKILYFSQNAAGQQTAVMDLLAEGALDLGIHLNTDQLTQFEAYYECLMTWNQSVNLTRITSYSDVQVKHFLDSLTICATTESRRSLEMSFTRLIDVGTGAGFPGVPIKIAWPRTQVTLLESINKRASFLAYLVDQLQLSDVEVVVGRAEEIGHDDRFREQFDLATARALATMPVLAEYLLPFCRIGGFVLAPKKGDVQAEVNKAGGAFLRLGGRLHDMASFNLPRLSQTRYVVVVEKVNPTPEKYPRRTGIPPKRPLI